MGLSEEDQLKAQEQHVIKDEDESKVVDSGCCQENGSSTCCGSSKLPENIFSFNLDTKRKGSKNQVSVNIGYKRAPIPHKVCTMPTWLETWESEDVYAALALIGAAVSVAVACNCYRQLG